MRDETRWNNVSHARYGSLGPSSFSAVAQGGLMREHALRLPSLMEAARACTRQAVLLISWEHVCTVIGKCPTIFIEENLRTGLRGSYLGDSV